MFKGWRSVYIVASATLLALAGAAPDAAAYVFVRAQNGANVRWNQGSNVVFRANERNMSGVSAQSLFSIISTALDRWIQASQGGLSFTFFQGTDPSRYPTQLGAPQDNSIFFTSTNPNQGLPCTVIGLTEVWYDQGSGAIRRSDMRLNDACFRFSTNPSDTRQGSSTVYLGDVVTHELGHAFGLDHSQNLQSTMFFTAARQMHKPSCDDQAAMVSSYSPLVHQKTGSISGRIHFNGSAVFGAYVKAIRLERGSVMAGAITEPNGTFRIAGLEPGTYTLVAEPYFPGSGSLNAFYSSMQTNVCGGSAFQRSFLIDENGELETAAVHAGSAVDIGSISVTCNAPTSPNFNQERYIESAPTLNISTGSVATMSVFSGTADHYYKIENAAGTLTASALSYTLFSRSDVQVEFLNAHGQLIGNQSLSPNVYAAHQSGYTNYDAKASASITTAQDVYVHVYTRANIGNTQFPASSLGVASTPYYVVSVTTDSVQNAVYPFNGSSGSRCEQSDAFAVYSQPGDPAPYSSPRESSNSSSAGCGTISDVSNDGPGGTFRLVNFAALALILGYFRRKLALQELNS